VGHSCIRQLLNGSYRSKHPAVCRKAKVHHFLLFHCPLYSAALFVRGTMTTATMCKIAVTLGAANVKRTRARRFRDQQDPPGILALIPDFYCAQEMPRHCRANLRMLGLEGGVRITVHGPVLSPDEGKTRIYFECRSKFSLTPFIWRDAPGSPITPTTPTTKKDKKWRMCEIM